MNVMTTRGLGTAALFALGVAIDNSNSKRKLAEERERWLGAIKWESLPLHWAITTVRGTGQRKIAILSDPNCRYCRTLEANVARLDDVTVHILPYPVLGPLSERQAKMVWCSHNRSKAWDDLMFRRIEPPAAAECDTPIEELLEFGWRIGARGTPTWFIESGERFTGAVSRGTLRRLLDEVDAQRRANRGSS